MTKAETIRAYIVEPLLAALAISLSINIFGKSANVAFMHDEARDILSLAVVLLGASLALWIGLFWISSSDFGKWLAAKEMIEPINAAYVASTVILLVACLFCIICAHLPVAYVRTQIAGEFFVFCGLATVPTLLNNTWHLLRLHSLFTRLPRQVPEIRSLGNKS